jgi:hypothetical protein
MGCHQAVPSEQAAWLAAGGVWDRIMDALAATP